MLAANLFLAILTFAQQPAIAQQPAVSPPASGSGQEPVPSSSPSSGSAPSPDPAPTAAAPASADEGWQELDQVILVVNEDMLTSRTLGRRMYVENLREPFTNEEAARMKEREFHIERVKGALQVQAGQDMGLDPAEIDRRVRDFLDRERERLGSAGLESYLKERSLTLFEFQDLWKDRLYAVFWDNYISGEGSVGAARQSRDRFVRPGYLRYCYRQCLQHPQLLPVIGGQEQTVVLQQLFIDPQTAGGPEKGLSLAEDLRRRISEGEDMGDLVERYDARKDKPKGGSTEPYVESRLLQREPAVGAFVAEAKAGDLSEVLEFKSKGHSFLRIVRLVERTPAVVPEVASVVVQKKLEERAQKDLEAWRRDQAFRVLYRASYVWPSEYAQR